MILQVEFEHLCGEHIAVLFVLAAISAALCIMSKKMSGKACDITFRSISVLLLVCEIMQDIILTKEGGDFRNYLPLHLCNLGIFVNLAAAFGKGRLRAAAAEISLVLIAPGALLALITPDWNYRPIFSWLPINCFFTHMLLATLPVMMYIRGYSKPSFRHFHYAYIFLIGAAVPIYLIDMKFHMNYMFLRIPPRDTPLSWMESFLGNPGYLAGALVLLAVILTVIYGAVTITGLLRKRAER